MENSNYAQIKIIRFLAEDYFAGNTEKASQFYAEYYARKFRNVFPLFEEFDRTGVYFYYTQIKNDTSLEEKVGLWK